MMISHLFFGSVVASCFLFFLHIWSLEEHMNVYFHLMSDCNVDNAKMWAFSTAAVILHCSCCSGSMLWISGSQPVLFVTSVYCTCDPFVPLCISRSSEQLSWRVIFPFSVSSIWITFRFLKRQSNTIFHKKKSTDLKKSLKNELNCIWPDSQIGDHWTDFLKCKCTCRFPVIPDVICSCFWGEHFVSVLLEWAVLGSTLTSDPCRTRYCVTFTVYIQELWAYFSIAAIWSASGWELQLNTWDEM